MHSLCTILVLCLSLSTGIFAQFWGPMPNRRHPIHTQRQQDFGNMLAMASLLGMEIPDLLLWNSFSGGGFNPVPMQQPRGLQRTLNLLNLLDGPDVPDPTGQGQGRGGKGGKWGKGGKAGGKGGRAAQGEEAGGGRARGRQRNNRRRKGQRAGK